MPFCKYCGTQLADGQQCSCEKSQAARQAAAQQAAPNPQFQQTQQAAPNPQFQQTQQAAPNPQFQQTQQAAPNPQFQQAAPNPQFQQYQQAAPNQQFQQTAAQVQNTVVNATKDVSPFLQSYFANPKQAVREIMEKDNLTMAITMTVIRALAMFLAIFGLLRNVCKVAQDAAKQSLGGFDFENLGAGVKVSAPILESLIYGALIAVIGMALFVLLLFIMVKIQKGTASIRAIYEASACNGALTSILLLLVFLFSFVSLNAALICMVLSLLSWVICGVLTAQIVCPNSNTGLFWILYFVGVVILFAIGFKLIPFLGLKAVGGISVSASTGFGDSRSFKIKDMLDMIKAGMGSLGELPNLQEILGGLMEEFF